MGVSDENLMFSTECDEPKVGRILRRVYKVEFTPQNLSKMWEKANKFRTLMGVEILGEDQFVNFFLNKSPYKDGAFEAKGLCARIDDWVGILWLTDINLEHQPFDASIHYTFFDGRQRGRIELCRDAIRYVFETYGFNRLWTRVPVYIRPTLNFVEKIGFRKEGRLKEKALYKGEMFDVNLYALTRAEVLTGTAFSDKSEEKNG